MKRFIFPSVLVIACCTFPTLGEEQAKPFRYPEAQEGKGSLKYHGDLPVLIVEGAPEDIGKQCGILTAKPAVKLLNYPKAVLNEFGFSAAWPLLVKQAKEMVPSFPKDYLTEIDSFVKATGADRDMLLAGNTMFDIKKLIACSTLYVEAERSATHHPLLGRNLDFPTCGYLQDYTLVEVYKPKGKHAFCSVSFPGLVGVLSGMNDAGLTLAVLEVYSSADDAVHFDPKGTPYAMCFRQVLEDCTMVEEAEKALRGMKRTTLLNLTVCDVKQGAVFEMTPKSFLVRKPEHGLLPCTNHFRCDGLCRHDSCRRYDQLQKAQDSKTLDLDKIAELLDKANQGTLTLQTMIFEPEALKLHLAFGKCPSSKLPMKELDLGPLLKGDLNSKGDIPMEKVP